MNTMKTKFLILVTMVMQLLVSCSKEDNTSTQDTLTPVTTTGANTAGCYINGELLIPKNGINSLSGYPIYGLTTGAGVNFKEPIVGDDYWFVNISNLKNKDHGYWIYIHLNNMEAGVGEYTVGQSNSEFYADASNNPQIIVRETNNGISGKTFISSSNSGTIKITRFDYQNGIYSGIFNVTLHNKDNPSDIIQVTDGRFDIKIATLNH